MKQEPLDLMCLRALKVNAASDRVALTAATIVVHAHAIARDLPDRGDEARRIIALARRLYAIMPTRDTLGALVDGTLADVAAAGGDRRRIAAARDGLVDRLWHHFQHGDGGTG